MTYVYQNPIVCIACASLVVMPFDEYRDYKGIAIFFLLLMQGLYSSACSCHEFFSGIVLHGELNPYILSKSKNSSIWSIVVNILKMLIFIPIKYLS
jgi:hypothetical protein